MNWVIIRYTDHRDNVGREGRVNAWRDYGGVNWWEGVLYEVIGYHSGSYREAVALGKQYSSTLKKSYLCPNTGRRVASPDYFTEREENHASNN